MDDFLREIQEDIAREKWSTLWARYGRVLLVVIVAVIVAAGGWQVNKTMTQQEHLQQTDRLLTAIKASSAEALAQAAEDAKGEHQAFAALIEAQLLESQGKGDAAEQALAEVASKPGDTLPYDLARALSVNSQRTGDTFNFTALERAGWQAIEAQEFAAAKQAFESIVQSDSVPPSLADRAKAGLIYIQGQTSAQ